MQQLSWHMSIREMPHQIGFSYPIFEWSYGDELGFRGGELRAWPPQGLLVFTDRRDRIGCQFQSVEDALVIIEQYKWGRPPCIDEVFKDILATKEKFSVKNLELEEAERIFDELRQKWQVLLTS